MSAVLSGKHNVTAANCVYLRSRLQPLPVWPYKTFTNTPAYFRNAQQCTTRPLTWQALHYQNRTQTKIAPQYGPTYL